ncbi:MAG: peptidase [Devosiaceae bacterium]|nr:peptidase [Devosiaceae bacterium]
MKTRFKTLLAPLATVAMLWTPSVSAQILNSTTVDVAQIVKNYTDIGLASYKDALNSAELMRSAIEDFLNNPNDETLTEARSTWRTARIPYEQSEVFVHISPVIENWVPRVNAGPVNESFLDYVAGGSSDNVINADTLSVGGEQVEIVKFTPEFIAESLHQVNGNVQDVASGYRVIEFLLWGQDNSGNEEPGVEEGAGQRPASDYDLENCTNENCARRGEYLYATVNLLIDDLNEAVSHWVVTGDVRRDLMADPEAALSKIITGLGSLSYGELAGDRLQRSLLLQSPDAELDRFSNNSHISYLFNARGVIGVYFGEYYSMEGKLTRGPSLADLMEEVAPDIDEKFRTQLGVTMARTRLLIDHARDVEAFDLMIAEGNETGNDLVVATVTALIDQSKTLAEMLDVLGLPKADFQGSDALDNPDAVAR